MYPGIRFGRERREYLPHERVTQWAILRRNRRVDKQLDAASSCKWDSPIMAIQLAWFRREGQRTYQRQVLRIVG